MHASTRKWLTASACVALLAAAAPGCASPAPEAREAQDAQGRTQGGARVTFSTAADWELRAENLSPRGRNPFSFPLEPGFRYVLENPEHPWGRFRVEVVVLDETEHFDVPGLGQFECAVIQEEEYFDGAFHERSHNWFCIDETTKNVYEFGEISWEIDQMGRKVFNGTWRVGEPDGNGAAEPGLLMPAVFEVGERYLFEGHEVEAYGYAENMDSGLRVETPAGTFEDCVRTREYSLTNPALVGDKVWCKGVGLVGDTVDGWLLASDALPHTDLSSFGKLRVAPANQIEPPVARISGSEATEIARKVVPGEATSVKVERLGRRNVYAVEIKAEEDGSEWDVFVDIATGEVVGSDR